MQTVVPVNLYFYITYILAFVHLTFSRKLQLECDERSNSCGTSIVGVQNNKETHNVMSSFSITDTTRQNQKYRDVHD